MPVESNIELGSGTLYFNGSDEGIAVTGGGLTGTDIEGIDTPEYWENELQSLIQTTKPAEFTFEAEIPRNWTLVKCQNCSYEFPVSVFLELVHGPDAWLCPICSMKRRLIRTNRGGGK